MAIGIEKNSNLSYEFYKDRYTQFDADFTLKNFSDRERNFYLIIDDRHGIGGAQFYNLDGSEKLFNLKENEQKTFSITVDNVVVKNIGPSEYEWASGTGRIDRIILSNELGEEVGLENNNFLGDHLRE